VPESWFFLLLKQPIFCEIESFCCTISKKKTFTLFDRRSYRHPVFGLLGHYQERVVMQDSEQLKQKFWEQGYLVLNDFFGPQLMDQTDAVIRQYFGENPDFEHEEEFLKKSQTEVIPWFPQNPDLPEYQSELAVLFNEMEESPRLKNLTETVLGVDWSRLYGMVMWSRGGSSGQAWHQDCAPEEASKFNLNRLVYTRDISSDVGGQTVIMPGSHQRGLLPAGDPHEDLDGQVVIEPRKGSLVLLHGHTWHRVLPVTGAFRFSTNFRASPAGTKADITDVCVYRNMRYRFSTSSVIEERMPVA
jgi:ectoine hydroxylase